jgi:hypothetical protein
LELDNFYVSYTKEKKSYAASLSIKNVGNMSQNVTMHVKVTDLTPPFWAKLFSKYFSGYPQEFSRDLQVLRDDSLTSHFEFSKPPFGRLKVESWATYQNGSSTIAAEPVYLDVPVDSEIILLVVLAGTFLILLIAFLVVRKISRRKPKTHSKKKK